MGACGFAQNGLVTVADRGEKRANETKEALGPCRDCEPFQSPQPDSFCVYDAHARACAALWSLDSF